MNKLQAVVMKVGSFIVERRQKAKEAVNKTVFLPVVFGMFFLLNGSADDIYDTIIHEGGKFLDKLVLPGVGLLIFYGAIMAIRKIANAGQRRFAEFAEHPVSQAQPGGGGGGGTLKAFFGIAIDYFIIIIFVGLLSGFGGVIIIKWGLVDSAGTKLLESFFGPFT
jgi:hypothetical protein